ncbi:hypothetical protein GOBAR_AA04137 [Gossypium barbadense]|uniref:Uncharacterized protein n=1 Tax=Gossypium barbadense TaxID=3634 RepID=A0A2P5YLF2_GOSBA|nr:hypothetical protein GOBAR_AA04137 [Gossypium barbadense]
MKISSKSILSPGRAREPSQISLSSSLTRRLRSNGSMKGGQASPMFPTNGKKRGCAFENPEPSSPKVTCIGQVRVKTKKQGKKFRACRSKRRGEVSFRKVDHTNNANNGSNGLEASSSFHLLSSGSQHHQQQECKKWVHFPVTICEALRAFGAEFNCFLPCRPSCMANQRDKEEKRGSNGSNENGSSCGAVFARDEAEVNEESSGRSSNEETILECQEQEIERKQEDDQQESTIREETSPHVSFYLDKLYVEENEGGLEEELLQEAEDENETKRKKLRQPKEDPNPNARKWENPIQKQKPEVKQKDGGDQPKARISIDRNPAPILLHPPRSSCSFPAPPPMATAAKGGGGCGPMAKGYESFVLTRCKSEPRRSSAKLAPDACFWKNRKLEPAAFEVGAAGVGF